MASYYIFVNVVEKHLEKLSDKRLFELIKNDNELAFESLFERHWQELYTLVASILSDHYRAQGIVQNLFIKIWEKRREIKNDNITGYLFKIAKQESLLQLRKNKIAQSLLDRITQLASSCDTEDQINFLQAKECFESSFKLLPEKTQNVFKLSRMENLSNKEIAEKLGVSIKTVEYHISNALKQLKIDLSDILAIILFVSFYR